MSILLKTTHVFLILLLTSLTYAQDAIGFKIGGNLGTLSGTHNTDTDRSATHNIGLQYGMSLEFAIDESLSIQSELLYIQKGVSIERPRSSSLLVFSHKYNYLEVPILVKLKFGNQESTHLFVNIGPTLGYALSVKLVFETEFNGESTTETEDLEFEEGDGFERLEVGAALGAGVGIPVGPGHLFFEARYGLGLTNLIINNESKHRGIGLSAGITIPLQKGDAKNNSLPTFENKD